MIHFRIRDGTSTFDIDNSYRRKGVREGWLILIQYTRNEYDEQVLIYAFI